MNEKVVLITGAAKRVGAVDARTLHAKGWRVIIHYRGSKTDAEALIVELNQAREGSACAIQADLSDMQAIKKLAKEALTCFGRIDALVNNASSFYATPLAEATEEKWNDIFSSNAKAPFFLIQALAEELKQRKGVIINMIDIHADRPLKDYNLYGMAKAALGFLTKSFAKDLAPDVRVNGIAPGMIMWPDDLMSEKVQKNIISRVPLKCAGEPQYIADAIAFLIEQPYITGQILAIDGGRSLNI